MKNGIRQDAVFSFSLTRKIYMVQLFWKIIVVFSFLDLSFPEKSWKFLQIRKKEKEE
jgi:hypothetical protein